VFQGEEDGKLISASEAFVNIIDCSFINNNDMNLKVIRFSEIIIQNTNFNFASQKGIPIGGILYLY